MVNCVLVIEGGGTGPALKTEMAKGFRALLNRIDQPIAKPRIIRGGGRNQALDKFNTAWRSKKDGDIVLLLIDSEEPVSFGTSKVEHLAKRDGWKNKPVDVAENNIFLMVCVMETWICADHDALKLFYSGGFDESKLPAIKTLEGVRRDRLYTALKKATINSKTKTPYSKGAHSFELIGSVDPTKLEALPHAKQFLDELKNRLKVECDRR